MFVELENTVEGLVRFDNLGDEYYEYDENEKIFCDELTEGMIEEIEEAKKLGLTMKFYNTDREEITNCSMLAR